MKIKEKLILQKILSIVLVFVITFSFPIDVTALSIGAGSNTIGSGKVSVVGNATYEDSSGTYELTFTGNTINGINILDGFSGEIFIPHTFDIVTDTPGAGDLVSDGAGGFIPGDTTTTSHTIYTIGDTAFTSDTNITKVIMEEGITTIGSNSFMSCTSLTSVTIPDSVVTIKDGTYSWGHSGPGAFSKCTSLNELNINVSTSNLETIGISAFFGSKLNFDFTIPDSVKYINAGAFHYASLTGVLTTDNSKLIRIEQEGFCCNYYITTVKLPTELEYIGYRAFAYNTKLNDLTIEEEDETKLLTIDASAFYNCSSLSSLIMPARIKSIGANAFGTCNNLVSITFEGSVRGGIYDFFKRQEYTLAASLYGGTDGVNTIYTSILGKSNSQGVATYGKTDPDYWSEGCTIIHNNDASWKALVAEFSQLNPLTFPHYVFAPRYIGGEIIFTINLTNQSKIDDYYEQNEIVLMPMTVKAVVQEPGTPPIEIEELVSSYVWSKDGVELPQAAQRNYFPATDKIGVFEYYVTAMGTNTDGVGLIGYSDTATIIVGPNSESDELIVPSLYLSNKVFTSHFVNKPIEIFAYAFNGEDIEYVWYDETGNIIDGETTFSFTPTEVGEYYCVVSITNSLSNDVETLTSNICKVVVGLETDNDDSVKAIVEEATTVTDPTVYSNLSTTPVTYELGETVQPLIVDAYGDGIVSYQWYANGDAITGETDNSYTPDLIGTNEYYVDITNSPIIRSNTAKTVRSNTATITILDNSVKKPIFDTNLDPNPITYYQDDIATFLGVSASSSDGGIISYQWYKNSSPLTNAISQAYMPVTTVVGTDTYYCIATNTKDGVPASETSNTVSVTVLAKTVADIETPNIDALFSPTTSYALNQDASEIKVSVDSRINGDLSYVWYKSTNEDLSNPTIVDSGTLDQTSKIEFGITPTTTSLGTTYYYCEVTNTHNGNTVTSRSSTAKIIVFEPVDDYDDNIEDTPNNGSDDTPNSGNDNPTSSTTSSETTSSTTSSETTSSTTSSETTSSTTPSETTSSTTSSETTSSTTSSETTSSTTPSETTSSTTSSETTSSTTSSETTSSSTTSSTTSSSTSSGTTSSSTSSGTTSSSTSSDSTSSNNSSYNTTSSISVGSYGTTSISSSYLESYLDSGTSQFNVTGSNIQGINFAPTSNSYNYKVNIYDSATGLNYSWSIRDSSKTAYDLDLAIETSPSLSNVNQGITNINYSPNSSQVIKFAHNGALNTNGATLYLTADSTLSDGTVWLYKLSNGNIILNEVVQGSVFNGQLQVSMQNCSDWVASTIRLVDITSNNLTNTETLFYNIPTDARFNIPQFQNIVVGTILNLDNINTNFLESYRFEGWYYDTAYTQPVTNTLALTVSNAIISSGIYPKMTYYNTSTPDVAFDVPKTNGFSLAKLF